MSRAVLAAPVLSVSTKRMLRLALGPSEVLL
jgi:hypothetical protein